MTSKKVLVIDDDKDLLQALNVRLRSNGYHVVFAADGISAITTARIEKPDVIILDLGLPGGDGFMVMKRLKSMAALAEIPIIVLTAREPVGNKEKSIHGGAAAFFQKPVDNAELFAAIERVLSDAPSSGQVHG
jgi:DNA-binding response OmpR family regulator